MSFRSFLQDEKIPFRTRAVLSSVSSMRCGGWAEIALYPNTKEELIHVISRLEAEGLLYRVLGRMTNTLCADGPIETIPVFTDRLTGVRKTGEGLICDCGCTPAALCRLGLSEGLSVLSGVATIPGSLGGAVRGNAGMLGCETGDEVIRATVFDPNSGRVCTLSSGELAFSYRESVLKRHGLILLDATLRATPSAKDRIREQIGRALSHRRATQPTGLPSLGSVFLRPEKNVSAGYYIDRAGLKGKRIGDAEVSTVHAGFIVNRGTATAKDVTDLIGYVKQTVLDRFAVNLQEEITCLP